MERKKSGGWKKTQNRMKEDTMVNGRRYSGGWKKTQHRMKGDTVGTVVDGRRHKIG